MSDNVAHASNLFDYFHERVETAKQELAVDLSGETSLYLASMLTERARTDRPGPPEETLAELHAAAAHAPPAKQVRAYRELGDRALYLVGYFKESVARKSVGVSYYSDMGSAAYRRVDDVIKQWFADAFGPVFRELSDSFSNCVELLGHIRSYQDEQPDVLSRLFEEWQRTGSEDSASRLRRLGVLIPRTRFDA